MAIDKMNREKRIGHSVQLSILVAVFFIANLIDSAINRYL